MILLEEKTNQLYFNQYKYKIGFELAHLNAARHRSHISIIKSIALRKNYNAILLKGAPWLDRDWSSIETNLHRFVDDIADIKQDGRFILGYRTGYLYHNDYNTIVRVSQLPYIQVHNIRWANPQCAPNTIKLRNNLFVYRSYFKSTFSHKVKNIVNTIKRNGLGCSPTLLKRDTNHIASGYFVDHNHMSELIMLQLIIPGCIRKTLNIDNNK